VGNGPSPTLPTGGEKRRGREDKRVCLYYIRRRLREEETQKQLEILLSKY
jgi:hypothetical protein